MSESAAGLVFYREMPESDADLLKSFAQTRDERRFRQLADRYLGLIFHTAMRRTENRQLAEEASQNVLCALANKARALSRHPERLAAWLHRAAVYESHKIMRTEASHHRRKKLRHPDEIPSTQPEAESPWSAALPALDTSLDKLSSDERTILLLHFYEKRTFFQIAPMLGKSADAVQKQSRRALEKLARLLRGKGVALSATAIGAGLSAEFSKAAPSGFAATFPITPASSPAATSVVLKPRILIPATLLVSIAPLIVQQKSISKANDRRAELLAMSTEANTPPFSSTRTRPVAATDRMKLPADFIILSGTWDEIRRATGNDYFIDGKNYPPGSYAAALDTFDDDTLIRLIREGVAARIPHEQRCHALRTLIFTLAKRDPRSALDTPLAAFPIGRFWESVELTGLGAVLGHWAKTDPDAATRWFREAMANGKLSIPSPFPGSDPRPTTHLKIPLLDSLIGSSPSLARDIIGELPPEERTRLLRSFPGQGQFVNRGIHFERHGNTGDPTVNIVSEDHSVNLLNLIREFAPDAIDKQMEDLLSHLSRSETAKSDIESFLAKAQLSENEAVAAAKFFVKTSNRSVAHADGSIVETVDEWKVKMAEQLAPGLSNQLLEEIREERRRAKTAVAEMQLQNLRRLSSPNDAYLIQILTSSDFESHLEAALEQANRIKDPEKRGQVIEKLQRKP